MHKRACKFIVQAGIHDVNPAKNKKAKFLSTKNLALIFLWVEGGARTHDIQNHNLTL